MNNVDIEDIMRERAILIGWKHSHGLTTEESSRLEFLNSEARINFPSVTPKMEAIIDKIRMSLDKIRMSLESTQEHSVNSNLT
jgi:hypothetical protein